MYNYHITCSYTLHKYVDLHVFRNVRVQYQYTQHTYPYLRRQRIGHFVGKVRYMYMCPLLCELMSSNNYAWFISVCHIKAGFMYMYIQYAAIRVTLHVCTLSV